MEIAQQVTKALENIEAQLAAFSTKADTEAKLGEVSAETKAAIENFGIKQREFADQLLKIERKGFTPPPEGEKIETWGEQFVKNARYADFAGGNLNKLRVEVKNTLTGSDTTVAPQRNAGIVAGAFQPFSMEALLPSTNTSSNAIEFTRENAFTNNAAEAAEGAQKANRR
jgi:hypothetical protein